jgi:surfeit locus 1 family protein
MTVGRGSEVPPRAKSIIFGLLALTSIITFLALGVWQVERRAWKLNLIAQVDQRVHAIASSAPGADIWPSLTAAHDAYRHITVHGAFRNDQETLIATSTVLGAGYWVLTPLQTDAGFTVLVNRGFVPTERRAQPTRTEGLIPDNVTVTGLLRMTEPGGRLLRPNVPAADRWYSRDVAALAAQHHLNNVAPYFIDADATPNHGGLPIGGLTEVTFPNNHLVYAFTWFSLAAMVIGVGVKLVLAKLRTTQ